MLRGVVIGRKNHYGSRAPRGTEVAAVFYSLVESAKLAGIGPHTYLRAATHSALRSGKVLTELGTIVHVSLSKLTCFGARLVRQVVVTYSRASRMRKRPRPLALRNS